MKLLSKIMAGGASLGLAVAVLFSFGAVASADCWQYNASGMTTSTTPVFNNICNVPNGTGNESDFVRIRPNTTGDPTSTSNNAAYVNSLNAACNSGDNFDIHTYVHNGAMPTSNNNGAGTAVAHGVQMSLSAATGSTNSNFNFGSIITATNAATVRDSATLNCANGPVKLTLVPSTVKVYGTQYPWTSLPDNSVNGTFRIGSPTAGSGDVWGCWDYRVVVVYEVTVTKLTPPPPQVTAQCDLFTVTATKDRKVTVSQFKYTAENAAIKNIVLNWGDNSESTTLTDSTKVVGSTHQYNSDGSFTINAVVTFGVEGKPDVTSGGAGTACAQMVTFSSGKPPVVTPPVTPPTTLVNTGAGSIAGLFAAATIAGAIAYRWMLGRRLSRD